MDGDDRDHDLIARVPPLRKPLPGSTAIGVTGSLPPPADLHHGQRRVKSLLNAGLRERVAYEDQRSLLARAVIAGLVPPAGPKPLRRGEGPAIHVVPSLLMAWMFGSSRHA